MNQNLLFHDHWQQELMYQLVSVDRSRKRVYICSPLRAETEDDMTQNMRAARAYMFYAIKKLHARARAPHAFLPLFLCDEIPGDRALALKFDLELMEQCDILFVCGNRISSGMRGEIARAAVLHMPIMVFDADVYQEVKKIVTQNNGVKNKVHLDQENFLLALSDPESLSEKVVK